MIFERKIYQKLLDWKKEANGTKALLIEGTRRIGKSTVAEEFAKKRIQILSFDRFFKISDEIRKYFSEYMDDLDTLFMLLSYIYNANLYKRDFLIIFDEIQFFPKARAVIKFLVKDEGTIISKPVH